jgi:hypothetical protein
MRRFNVAGAFCSIWLIISPVIFGQSTPAKSPVPTKDRQLEDALTDIALLKRLVREQGRRIAELEKTLRTQQAEATAPVPVPVEVRPKVLPKPLAARWQNPLAWAQIQEGMSRAQVEDILGKAASVDAVIDSQTLNYKGDAPSGGVLTGSVNLTDDRVIAVNPPEF